MSKTIHIFDLDDTLTETGDFVDFLNVKNGEEIDISKHHPKYFSKVRAAFWDKLAKPTVFVRKGNFVVPINKVTGEHFDGDAMYYFEDKKYQRMFEVINDTLVVRSFPGFHSDANTIGSKINQEVFDDYKKAKNRMILTGRDENLRKEIEENLKNIGVEFPEYGLKMYSGNEGIKNFKNRIILESIEKYGWDEVHFYEDRQDWLHFAEGAVNEKCPDVKFVPHFISNIKNEKKF